MLFLLVLLLGVQYRIWVGKDSLADVWRLEQRVEAQRAENAALERRNRRLAAEVRDLKDGEGAIERRAREELGMIHRDETLFQFTTR